MMNAEELCHFSHGVMVFCHRRSDEHASRRYGLCASPLALHYAEANSRRLADGRGDFV